MLSFLRRPRRRRPLAQAASDWMIAQPAVQPAELSDLLERARRQLGAEYPRADPTKLVAAILNAWSEVESIRTRTYVDLGSSTPHLIWLVDEVAGVRRPVPAADLVRMLGPRSAAAANG